MRLPLIDGERDKQCWELYRQGFEDQAIARAVGVSVTTIRVWRYRRGLPPNLTPKLRVIREKHKKFLRLVPVFQRDRWSDAKIAQWLGVSEDTVAYWRNKLGLSPFSGHTTKPNLAGVPMSKVLSPEQCKVMRSFLRLLLLAREYTDKVDVLELARYFRDYVYRSKVGDDECTTSTQYPERGEIGV